MANFWDLPKVVRDKIYRLHLVREEPTSGGQFEADVRLVFVRTKPNQKLMPPICAISRKAEREAAPIYYGENHFEFGRPDSHFDDGPSSVTSYACQRHLRLIRKVTFTWDTIPKCSAHFDFLELARMKGLRELYIRVDEIRMVNQMLTSSQSRYNRQNCNLSREPTPQEHLTILRYPGLAGLLSITGVPLVSFIKKIGSDGTEYGGPISGGVLETKIGPKMMAPKTKSAVPVDEPTQFPFLALPPEIRNRVYGLLLEMNGMVHPSPKPPSSAPKGKGKDSHTAPASALCLLAVNKQIHDEAVGIFYHSNSFEFYYPTQLHAFLLSLGTQRLGFIRDITLHYYNTKCGGVDVAHLSLATLKQLTGLRRLHVVCDEYLSLHFCHSGWMSKPCSVERANPLLLPGLKVLFELRGIIDIRLRDKNLEQEMTRLEQDDSFPKFAKSSRESCLVRLSEIVEHLNTTLAQAQVGKVNKKLLDDDKWHLKKVFPTLDDD